MQENEIREIALKFIEESDLKQCKVDSIDFFPRGELSYPETVGDTWIIHIIFDRKDENSSCDWGQIYVDDATGTPRIAHTI
jgi:hypothetical protein